MHDLVHVHWHYSSVPDSRDEGQFVEGAHCPNGLMDETAAQSEGSGLEDS